MIIHERIAIRQLLLLFITSRIILNMTYSPAFVMGSAQRLKLRDYGPLVLPVGVILIALSVLLFANFQELTGFMKPAISTPCTLLFILLIPMILLIVDCLTPASIYESKGGGG